MTIARTTKETFDYVLLADRGLSPDQQTTFILRHLSNATMLAIENLMRVDVAAQTVSMRSGDAKLIALRAGLAGWKNLRDEHGAEVEFFVEAGRRQVLGVTIEDPASIKCLDRLTTADARELADAIVAGNTLTKDDAKN